MSKTVLRRIPWIAVGAAIVLSGCYTVIMHPKVENERMSAQELRVDCVDCHQDYHVYPYDPYDSFFGADYYWTNPHYGYYYGYPWWWNDYYWNYYYNPDDPSDYPTETREYARPAYREGTPTRSAGSTYMPPLKAGTPRRGVMGDSESQGTDTQDADTTTAGEPASRTLDDASGERLVGQPLWTSPKGTLMAKPPSLRQGLNEDVETVPESTGKTKTTATKSGSSGSGSKSTTTAKPAKQTPPADEKPKEEKKPEEPRGRPTRNPR